METDDPFLAFLVKGHLITVQCNRNYQCNCEDLEDALWKDEAAEP